MPLIMKTYGNAYAFPTKWKLFLSSWFCGETVRKLIGVLMWGKMSLICTPRLDYITLQSCWHRCARCVSHYTDTLCCFTSRVMGITTGSTWSLATDTCNCGGGNFSSIFSSRQKFFLRLLLMLLLPLTIFMCDTVIITRGKNIRVPRAINKRPLN